MVRTFIAVDVLSSSSIESLQQQVMEYMGWSASDVKPVEKENFHFTLAFLGEIDEDGLQTVRKGLSQLRFEPFKLMYFGIGAFPGATSPRVVWVGTDQAGGQQLVHLANAVCARIGFKPDKPFSPHMTIFRSRTGRKIGGDLGSAISAFEGKIFGTDFIDAVHIKKSELHRSGPVYSNIQTVSAVARVI